MAQPRCCAAGVIGTARWPANMLSAASVPDWPRWSSGVFFRSGHEDRDLSEPGCNCGAHPAVASNYHQSVRLLAHEWRLDNAICAYARFELLIGIIGGRRGRGLSGFSLSVRGSAFCNSIGFSAPWVLLPVFSGQTAPRTLPRPGRGKGAATPRARLRAEPLRRPQGEVVALRFSGCVCSLRFDAGADCAVNLRRNSRASAGGKRSRRVGTNRRVELDIGIDLGQRNFDSDLGQA